MKNNKIYLVYIGISMISIVLILGMVALSGNKMEDIIPFVAYGIFVMILITNLSSFVTSLCYKHKKMTLKNSLLVLTFIIINSLFILFCFAMILVNYLLH